jgi:hypothetical protein
VNKVCCMSVDRDNTGIYTEGQYIKKQITNSQSRWKLKHIPVHNLEMKQHFAD